MKTTTLKNKILKLNLNIPTIAVLDGKYTYKNKLHKVFLSIDNEKNIYHITVVENQIQSVQKNDDTIFTL
jgi:hypothetical protein